MKKIRGRTNRILHTAHGFTLVELIVVIVIIAILAAALLVSLVGYIRSARESTAIAQCRSCVTAAQATAAERYAGANPLRSSSDPGCDDYLAIQALAQSAGEIQSLALNERSTVVKLVYKSTNDLIVVYSDGKYSIGTKEDARAYFSDNYNAGKFGDPAAVLGDFASTLPSYWGQLLQSGNYKKIDRSSTGVLNKLVSNSGASLDTAALTKELLRGYVGAEADRLAANTDMKILVSSNDLQTSQITGFLYKQGATAYVYYTETGHSYSIDNSYYKVQYYANETALLQSMEQSGTKIQQIG